LFEIEFSNSPIHTKQSKSNQYQYSNQKSNKESSPEVRDLLGDADVLPNQVMREVVYLFTNSNTHISSHPPSTVTVEDDDESIANDRKLILYDHSKIQ